MIFRFGATLELGRSARPTMRPLWSYRVDGADSSDRKPRCLIVTDLSSLSISSMVSPAPTSPASLP